MGMWALRSSQIRIGQMLFRCDGLWRLELQQKWLLERAARIARQGLNCGVRQRETIANRLRILIGLEWHFEFSGLLCRRASRCERDGLREFHLMECAAMWWRRRGRGELRDIGGARMGGNTMSGILMCVSV